MAGVSTSPTCFSLGFWAQPTISHLFWGQTYLPFSTGFGAQPTISHLIWGPIYHLPPVLGTQPTISHLLCRPNLPSPNCFGAQPPISFESSPLTNPTFHIFFKPTSNVLPSQLSSMTSGLSTSKGFARHPLANQLN